MTDAKYSQFPITITQLAGTHVAVIDHSENERKHDIDTTYMGWMQHSPFESAVRAAIRKFLESTPTVGTSVNYVLHVHGFFDYKVEVA
jgi:hypothetical protein